MPKRDEMTMDGSPLDPALIEETLKSLEGIKVKDIEFGPNLVGGVMSDAALIIRALLKEPKNG